MIQRKDLRKPSLVLVSFVSPVVLLSCFISLWQLSLTQKLNKHSLENMIKVDNFQPKKPIELEDYLKYATFEKEKIIAENTVRTTLFSALGGLFFVVTAYFSWENLKLSKKQLKATEYQQLSEKHYQGVKLVLDDNTRVHLPGIYALKTIAESSEEHYDEVMYVLTDYVRIHAPYLKTEILDEEHIKVPRSNIQAILNILSMGQYKRKKRHQENMTKTSFRAFVPDLRQSDLSRIQIGAKSDLSGAILIGTNLEEANLMGVNLANADLTGANLTNVKLASADLTGAKLKNADLTGVDFANATLKNTCLQDTNLSQVKNLKPEQISNCYWNEQTQFPPGIKGNHNLKLKQAGGLLHDCHSNPTIDQCPINIPSEKALAKSSN